MIMKEMFYIPIKLKPELAHASMTTSDVNNQWRSNFQQQIKFTTKTACNTRFFACLHTLFSSHTGYMLFQDITCNYTHFRKNKFPVFSCTAILRIFPSLCYCRSSLMPRSRFANGFFCTCQVSL